jgi:NADH:ubiquinone oxidoreductase subunit 5 (subunit L)/multisubunit Na+/H+ antiporter MnhA subunit
LMNAYYLDTVYHWLFEVPAYAIAEMCARVFESAAIAGIPRALAGAATSFGDLSRGWETGYLRRYGLTIAIGAAALLYFVFFTMHGGAGAETH